jgi:excisionase family DNA binding protein
MDYTKLSFEEFVESLKSIKFGMKRVLNLKEASEYTGLSIRTLRAAIKTGKLPHSKINRKNIYIKISDIDHFLLHEYVV